MGVLGEEGSGGILQSDNKRLNWSPGCSHPGLRFPHIGSPGHAHRPQGPGLAVGSQGPCDQGREHKGQGTRSTELCPAPEDCGKVLTGTWKRF